MHPRWLVVLFGTMALSLGCGDGEQLSATVTATPAPTLPPIATRLPAATSTPVNAYPPGTRTGVQVIDDALDAIEAGDPAAFMQQLSFHPYRCDNAPAGVAGANPCPAGVPEGSVVEVIALGGCDVVFIAREQPELADEVAEFVRATRGQGVYAASELQEGRLSSPLPLRYMVILSGGYSLLLDDRGVTHLGLPCDSVGPAQLYHPADRPILPPL
jgi:hypothetical protein